MSGMLPSTGTELLLLSVLSSIRPPSTTMLPSSTSTIDSKLRLLVMIPPCAAVSVFWIDDSSW